MTDVEIEQRAAKETMARGYHDIPDDAKLKRMSFVELAALLSSCESGSARFNVVERELKKHLAKDQAEINRPNILLGACIGLVGVVLGAYLKNSPPLQQVTPSATVQEMKKSDLAVKPPFERSAHAQPFVVNPAKSPEPAQSNAQPSKSNP